MKKIEQSRTKKPKKKKMEEKRRKVSGALDSRDILKQNIQNIEGSYKKIKIIFSLILL